MFAGDHVLVDGSVQNMSPITAASFMLMTEASICFDGLKGSTSVTITFTPAARPGWRTTPAPTVASHNHRRLPHTLVARHDAVDGSGLPNG
jgi:hypothetical protein